ncbi:DUF6985 domain-containing protein [Thermomonospora amylolytica]|uniref:DUF6985 domain-containing protein n=1 Tax=Thermomonospora amylolytica TaxID=1411117 RepID=UPI000E6C9F02|nr:hypothetical protein [Thermomonospora amylolytica]
MTVNSADFVWDEFHWTTPVRFPEGSGPTHLRYAPEGRDDRPLDEAEISAVAWTIDNLPLLWQAMQPSLHIYYRQLRAAPDGLDPEDLPAIDSAEDVVALIRLQAVNVHQISKDGLPYVGLEFACPWDEEHGLGILMHGSRTVDIGGADTAYLLWIARRDSELPTPPAPMR